MQIALEILRRKSPETASYWEKFPFETQDENATVATILCELNEQLSTRSDTSPIRWECSCLQKKCGACAMVINGKPCLACDSKLCDAQKKGVIRIEPLRKFPVVCDLIVDRRILFENLKTMSVWLEESTIAKGEDAQLAYEASRCLQCGCCLEICPNFASGGNFFGMAGFAPTARLISELPPEQQKALQKNYRKHIYEGCGKSLACRNVCPAGLDIDQLLVNTNAAAVWKFPFRKRK